MGARGPAPKPTALKMLEGNPGKQKLNKNEPKPKELNSVPNPPKRLLPEAKKEWKRLAPPLMALGLLTEVDTAAFAEVCQNYAYYLRADAEILKADGIGAMGLQVSKSGYAMVSPLHTLRRQYYEMWKKGLADFGLTPASRSRLDVGDSTLPSSSTRSGSGMDDMEALLMGNY